jgi:glycerate kinase
MAKSERRSLRFLIAPDKFKGSLTAVQAAQAIRRGVRRVFPDASCTLLPMTDGGEGFVSTLVRATGGKFRRTRTTDPLGKPRWARWGILGDGKTAVIGLTEASALALVPPDRRNPELAGTEGTGRLIAKALAGGFRTVLIGLGGSATNDGGVGLVAPLGFRFVDKKGRPVPLHGQGLARLHSIVRPSRPFPRFIVATDVANPLYGPRGAAFQFARQKGASPSQIRRLDHNLRHLSRLVAQTFGFSPHARSGAGAAGGCGYGLMAFLKARPVSGFQVFADAVGLKNLIRQHDMVMTGEGCLDAGSLLGKGPVQLGILARKLHKPCLIFAGRLALSEKGLPFTQAIGIVNGSIPEKQALRKAARLLETAVARILRKHRNLL